jgi:endonuclease/exonuclease/phosphatase family metal-dependent hydrolase
MIFRVRSKPGILFFCALCALLWSPLTVCAKKTLRVMTYNIHVGVGTKGDGLSYPADKPVKRIDHIFYRTVDRVRAKKAWVLVSLASDHVPVVAELEVQ